MRACYFSDDQTLFDDIGNKTRNLLLCWHAGWRREYRTQRGREVAVHFAMMVPSLIAEMTLPIPFWNDHLSVLQMSAIMAASWAFTWWLTCAFVFALNGSPSGSVPQHHQQDHYQRSRNQRPN
jgi:hypothetical protein